MSFFLQKRTVIFCIVVRKQIKELEEEKANLTKRNAYLKLAIEESNYLIAQQKSQITRAYLEAFSDEEETACQELIKVHQQWFTANEEENFSESAKLFQQLSDLRTQLKSRLGDKFVETVEVILADFAKLYQYRWTLEKQAKEKSDITQYQTELETLKTQIESGIADLKQAIKRKVEVSELQRLITANNQLLSQTVSLLRRDNTTTNYQLTNEQNNRLQILEQQLGFSSSSSTQSLATQQFAETLDQTTSLQARIKGDLSPQIISEKLANYQAKEAELTERINQLESLANNNKGKITEVQLFQLEESKKTKEHLSEIISLLQSSVENDYQLSTQQNISLKSLNSLNQYLTKQLVEAKIQIQKLEEQLQQQSLSSHLLKKEEELANLKSYLEGKLSEESQFLLDIMLEVQVSLITKSTNGAVKESLDGLQASLRKKLKETKDQLKVQEVCQKQQEVIKLKEVITMLNMEEVAEVQTSAMNMSESLSRKELESDIGYRAEIEMKLEKA